MGGNVGSQIEFGSFCWRMAHSPAFKLKLIFRIMPIEKGLRATDVVKFYIYFFILWIGLFWTGGTAVLLYFCRDLLHLPLFPAVIITMLPTGFLFFTKKLQEPFQREVEFKFTPEKFEIYFYNKDGQALYTETISWNDVKCFKINIQKALLTDNLIKLKLFLRDGSSRTWFFVDKKSFRYPSQASQTNTDPAIYLFLDHLHEFNIQREKQGISIIYYKPGFLTTKVALYLFYSLGIAFIVLMSILMAQVKGKISLSDFAFFALFIYSFGLLSLKRKQQLKMHELINFRIT